jgi:hypothetical protein
MSDRSIQMIHDVDNVLHNPTAGELRDVRNI